MGYGTIIVRRFAQLAHQKGARMSLSSTTPSNVAMHAVFARLGYVQLDAVAVFPSHARFNATAGPVSSGSEFLEALGAAARLREIAAGAAEAFAPCSAAAAAATMEALAEAAGGEAGGLLGMGLLPADYRVYAPSQAGPSPAPSRYPSTQAATPSHSASPSSVHRKSEVAGEAACDAIDGDCCAC